MLALKGRDLNYEVDMMKDKYFSSCQPSLENFDTSIITIKDSIHHSAADAAAVALTAAHIQEAADSNHVPEIRLVGTVAVVVRHGVRPHELIDLYQKSPVYEELSVIARQVKS